ncbi:hypothetical protein, variant [Aphanomyces invadans]|uniref:Beta-adaptin appendage C-terminal subdomain domain-containing protein n=1 Tax=Aphanomyces invadans TaxID=157072 RepID=A0A024TNG7_9STRA|nr:hypothetical protein, variant [Aphanomyces invadans]ETV95563.1 hypothetical protein, variant [Aphanomyces invadans]|eukprot:XP_008875756.1 hypothetical protein, variant [Aphanomyces invadans]
MALTQRRAMRSVVAMVVTCLVALGGVAARELPVKGELLHQPTRSSSGSTLVPAPDAVLDQPTATHRLYKPATVDGPLDAISPTTTSASALLPADATLDDLEHALFSILDSNDEDDTASISATWCTDVGVQFELDFRSAFADLRGFGHFFSQRMTSELDHKYTVSFRDLSPSHGATDKAFVVFSACSSPDDTTTTANTTWLAAFVSNMHRFLDGHGKALHASSEQAHTLDDLFVYALPVDQPSARIQIWPVAVTIALVPPDSNGVPTLHLSLRVQNTGPLPVRVFHVVCHDVRGFRDTVLPIVPTVVVPPGADVTLSVEGSIVQDSHVEPGDFEDDKEDVESDDDDHHKAPMRLHIVQSSGNFIDLNVAASLVRPTLAGLALTQISQLEDEGALKIDDLLPKTTRAPLAAVDARSSSLSFHASTPAPSTNRQHQDWHRDTAAVPKATLRVVGKEYAVAAAAHEGEGVLPMASFPSSEWKAASTVLLLGVFGVTAFFVYGKLRRRTSAAFKHHHTKTKQAAWEHRRREDAADDKECEMMLRSTRQGQDDSSDDTRELEEPSSSERARDILSTPPIQLNHAWGRSTAQTTVRLDEPPIASFRPLSLQPHPMQPVVPPPYQLQLDLSVRLHPKRFESLWEESVVRKSWTQSAVENGALPPTGVVIQVLESQGILCMASGSVAMVDKYLFYSYEVALGQFLFVEIVANPVTLDIASSVRCHRDVGAPAVDALAALVHALIQAILESIKARGVALG